MSLLQLDDTLRWTEDVEKLVISYRALDISIVLTIIYIESKGDPTKRNPKFPAVGLMGVVGREGGEGFEDRPTCQELIDDPELNITWGIKILAYFHSIEETLVSALYRYSGGRCWDNFGAFIEGYWKPFAKVIPMIEAKLREQEWNG